MDSSCMASIIVAIATLRFTSGASQHRAVLRETQRLNTFVIAVRGLAPEPFNEYRMIDLAMGVRALRHDAGY